MSKYSRPPLRVQDAPRALSRFTYIPSADGKDTNLLIFLPGLGDTHANFAAFARSLNLPQSACLILQGPMPLPLDDMDGGAWYPSFEDDGERTHSVAPRICLFRAHFTLDLSRPY